MENKKDDDAARRENAEREVCIFVCSEMWKNGAGEYLEQPNTTIRDSFITGAIAGFRFAFLHREDILEKIEEQLGET